MYYDLLVHTNKTIGENSIEELAEMAKLLSINCIGTEDVGIKKINGIDIVTVSVISSKSVQDMENDVKKLRQKSEVVIVSGGDYEINRAACENKMVDILIHPELNRKDSGLDHICAKAAHENNVSIGIDFHQLLESYKKQRIIELANVRKNIMLCKKYKANIVLVSSALTKWDMRNCRDMASLLNVLGMNLEDSIRSVSKIPENIIKNNKLSLEGKKWSGVSVV